MKLDRQLIKDFRDKMNSPEIFTIFRDYNGKNYWSVICSAMDWVDIAVDGINIELLSGDNSNEASIKMITFLSCIDVLWEGIQQLHRVFISRKSIPFEKESSVFLNKLPVYDKKTGTRVQTDNEYFKTIRAIFAAHPVNLNDQFGDYAGDKDERWFAGWSGGTFSKANFGVFLYSNKPGIPSRSFDIRFAELFSFAYQRYDYLKMIMDAADEVINNYKQQWRETEIICDKEDCIGWINTLIKENDQRGATDFIKYMLQDALLAFTVEPGCRENKMILEEYRKALIKELQQIQDALQFMAFDNIDEVEGELPEKYIYPASKLFEENDVMFSWGMEVIQEYLDGIVDLNMQESIKGIQVLARAGIWYKEFYGL